jgi:uncharacterized protein YbjT (DUF2867 family)
MRILVLGASKGIGKLTVEAALAAGHEVRAFARSAETLELRPGLERMNGDATAPSDLTGALQGMEAVILAIGLGTDLKRLMRRTTLFSDAARALIPLMEAHGPRRLVAVTGFGAGDSAQAMSTLERMGHRAILGRAYADKDVQEGLIRDSALDWTLVRPVILTHGAATGSYKVLDDPATWRNGMIPRADVADYLVRAAVEGLNVGQAVVLTR